MQKAADKHNLSCWSHFDHSVFMLWQTVRRTVTVFSPGCRERKWKQGQAKRFIKLGARSNLDVESRAAVKAKQEAAAVRRRAAWIAKEVTANNGFSALHAGV